MPINPGTASHLAAMFAASLSVVACAVSPSSAKPTPVEVWRGGDDGLTSRFADAIETAFRTSSDFMLSSGKKPGTLVVTIPTNVSWKKIGNRTQVLYTVTFTPAASQQLGASMGSCWDDALSECAGHVFRDAQIAASKIH